MRQLCAFSQRTYLATLPPCPFCIFRLAGLISSWWLRQMPKQLVVQPLETQRAQRHRSRTLPNRFISWETFAYLLILFAACGRSIYSNYSNNSSGENDCWTDLERSCGFLIAIKLVNLFCKGSDYTKLYCLHLL